MALGRQAQGNKTRCVNRGVDIYRIKLDIEELRKANEHLLQCSESEIKRMLSLTEPEGNVTGIVSTCYVFACVYWCLYVFELEMCFAGKELP